MTLNGLESLTLVRHYLATEVVAIVPRHVAAELRAAVKLIDAAMIELAALPSMLPAEIAAMRKLYREGQGLLAAGACRQSNLQAQGDRELGSLSELIDEHREAGEQLSGLVTRLQDARSAGPEDAHAHLLADLLDRIYQVLGQQARDRLAWQSVFPVLAVPGSDSALSTPKRVRECLK